MSGWWDALFGSHGYMPHGHCYLWQPSLVGLHLVSDLLIGLSYVAISGLLVYLVWRVRNLPFQRMYLAFGAFIIACAMTHLMSVWTLWTPVYWLDGGIKAVTALVSVATALLLPGLIPKAISFARAVSAASARGEALESTLSDLETLYDKARQLDQAKTAFFANVSHELRTPLTLILGPTAAVLDRNPGLPPQDRQDLGVVMHSARSLLKQVNDLLEIARMEAGKTTIAYSAVDLAALVRQTADAFQATAQARRLTLDVAVPPRLATEIDRDKAERILLNLLANALKFTPPGGRIHCRLADGEDPPTGMVALVVEDSGPGVPLEHREAIFERFYQVDGGDSRTTGGTGLGLAIVHDFVTRLGGTVAVDDSPLGGARFTVRLPSQAPNGVAVDLAPPDAAGRAPPAATLATLDELQVRPGPSAAGGPDRMAGRVLIVEDNVDMNRYLAEQLSGEFDVQQAFDGAAGLQAALSAPPDAVVTDLMMPRMGGEELLAEIRRRPELDGVPVIILTAKGDDDLRVRLLQQGAQDYVIKPFVSAELQSRVRNVVTIKKAREVLQAELASQMDDLQGLATEVSSRKRDLKHALDSMQVAWEHAEHASQVKGTFLNLVSHELRAPLTTLQLHLQMLERDDTLSDGQSQRLAKIRLASKRMQGLVETLLEYTRLEAGRLTVQPAPIALDELALEIAGEFQPAAAAKGLTLTAHAAADLPPLASDGRLIAIVLANLLDNAIKYTDQGGVSLQVSGDAACQQVTVTDTGLGIAEPDQSTIFEAFNQVESVAGKHRPGFGLGLAIVQTILTAIGATIDVQSTPGTGSTFTVTFPAMGARTGPDQGSERPPKVA